MKTIFLLSISAVLSFALQAQSTIKGSVTDQKGTALTGANVYIEGSYDGAATDASGAFSFTTAERDSVVLIVEFIGFEASQSPIFLNDDTVEINVQLKEAFNELTAVTISAGAFEAGESKRAVALKPLDIVTTAGAQGDVIGAMQTLPGTTRNGDSGRLFVRGGSSDETKTYVDGMLVHQPYTRSAPNTAVRGRFNPFIFSGTTFNTGGYSAEYGQALSSVLLLNTKGMEAKDELNLSIMSVGSDVAGTKTWKTGSIIATGGYINLGLYTQVLPVNMQFHQAPSSLNGSISLRQQTSETGMVKVYAVQSNTRFGASSPSLENGNMQRLSGGDNNTYINTSWKDVAGEKWVLRAGMAYSTNTDEKKIDEQQIGEINTGQHAKFNATCIVSEKVKWKTGVDFFNESNTFEWNGEKLESSTSQRAALFSEVEWFVSNKLAFKTGLRSERKLTEKTQPILLSPRLNAAYRTGDNSQVSLAYGMFYQEGNNRNYSNAADLKEARAQHLIANYQYTASERTFRIEVYQKQYENLTKWELADDGSQVANNDGFGHARGLDIWFRDNKSIKNADYWISYSFINAEKDVLDFPEAVQPSYVAAHNLSAVYKHWFPDLRCFAGASYSFTSPRFYDNPNEASFHTAKMDAVHQVNANLAYLHRENIIIYASATNLLGTEQQFGYQFAQTPDANGVFASQAIRPFTNQFFFIGCFITLSKTGANQLNKLN